MRISVLFATILLLAAAAVAQPLAVDAKGGLSIFSGGGSSTALVFSSGVEIPIQKDLAFRPGLDITTHSGTPIEITGLLKYTLPSATASLPIYLDGGLAAWFYSGGSSLGLDFGAGTYFTGGEGKVRIPAEIRMGPIFDSGGSSFQISLAVGVRFSLGD